LLGVDGQLERYSRGLDTWVPLDSEASFSAMKRSIDVQRKANDGNHRPRVLLRVLNPKPLQFTPIQPSMVIPHWAAALNATTAMSAPPPTPNNGKLPFNLLGSDVPEAPTAPPQPIPFQNPFRIVPPAPEPAQPNLSIYPLNPLNIRPTAVPMPPSPTRTTLPPPPPSFAPPAPLPPPPFPFDLRGEVNFPRGLAPFPIGPPPTSMPVVPAKTIGMGPLLPEHPPLPASMLSPNAETASLETTKSDADAVILRLHDLEAQMQRVGSKVDQLHTEEKKHYDSLRRGLRRISVREKQSIEVPVPNANGDFPCCICNYCLEGM
jgi:hypothetical protein